MSLKPIDIVDKKKIAGRQEMWNYIRKTKKFSTKDVAYAMKVEVSKVQDFITGLYRAGYLSRVVQRTKNNNLVFLYILTKDCGNYYPKVNRNGNETKRGATGQEKMWTAFKVLKTFTVTDIAMTTQVTKSTAKTYIHALVKANYIITVTKPKPGHTTTYRANKRKIVGQHPVMIQRNKQLYDPNLKEVIWQPAHLRKEQENA